jgi:hypothetical protein
MNAELTSSSRDRPILVRRTCFVSQARPGQQVLREFVHPKPSLAVCDVSTSMVISESPVSNGNGEFLFALFPANSGTLPDRQREARRWLSSAHDGHDGVLEVAAREDRILWKAGRAAFLGPPERADEVFSQLLEFAFLDGQIHRLEAVVAAAWTEARGDIPLTHQVAENGVALWPHVNDMTCRVTKSRMDCCDLRKQLSAPAPENSMAARQLLADLCDKARLSDRLAAVETRIEAMMNLYQVANDRLSAYSYFRREWWLEVWIILVIVVELVAIFVQLWRA